MNRTDYDYRTVIVNCMGSILNCFSSSDIRNDIPQRNKLMNTVKFMRDLLTPYMNKGENTKYNPTRSDDEIEDVHSEIQELMRLAMTIGVLPPEIILEDVNTFIPGNKSEEESAKSVTSEYI